MHLCIVAHNAWEYPNNYITYTYKSTLGTIQERRHYLDDIRCLDRNSKLSLYNERTFISFGNEKFIEIDISCFSSFSGKFGLNSWTLSLPLVICPVSKKLKNAYLPPWLIQTGKQIKLHNSLKDTKFLTFGLAAKKNWSFMAFPKLLRRKNRPEVCIICFVHPIFLSFGFWYFGNFSRTISFPLFFQSCLSCLAKCKQRLHKIFVLS